MDSIRAFIAVDIGDEIRGRLDELQRRLKKVHANVRWVNPRTLHLTVVFLGELPHERVDTVMRVLDNACRGRTAFELDALGTGTFGRPKNPRVIWTGINDCPALMKLQDDIAHGLFDAGILLDGKPFSPHLTLGRVKGLDHHIPPLMEKLECFRETNFGSNRIDGVELIQSTLTPRGAEYTVLHRAMLGTDPVPPESGGNESPQSIR